ncbi:uncharacterized protein [Halyomorpha halys]|uniref:uncharacterized protein n=1 Tax=Halyomorpha halys TaxID=286706 RepID=UPI0006D51D8A|nr:uncharacterized protein LOC106686425 [Halyomorpha halys]
MLGAVASSLPSFLLRLLIINEESLLAFCCLFHGDITRLPTVLFIFSVVLYKLENPEMQVRLPESFHQGHFKFLAKFAELSAHWIATNAVITCWHLFYSSLCSYFTSVIAKEVEEPSLWPMGMYWSRTITKTERVRNTFLPTVIGTLLSGYLIAMIFLNGSQGRMMGNRRRI